MPTVLITGANRGIGLALTRAYLEEAATTVIATCRAPDKASELQELANKRPNLAIEKLDIATPENRAAFVQKLNGTPVDCLIQCAGILSAAHPEISACEEDESQLFGSLDEKAWLKTVHINALAPLMLLEQLMPNLRAGSERKVALLSSHMGSTARAAPNFLAYRSSKALLNNAARCIAMGLDKEGFTIVLFHPGWVRMRMGGPEGDLTPEESAKDLKKLIDAMLPAQNGSFLRHDGSIVPW
jgi:NAD(P)-dependent dehydrogenase (short-subunit alcohol dehydrogenase family)